MFTHSYLEAKTDHPAGNLPTSLHNITFHWLAGGFAKLAATGCRCDIMHFCRKYLLVHFKNEYNCILNFHLGSDISWMYGQKTCFMAPLLCTIKLNFQTYI